MNKEKELFKFYNQNKEYYSLIEDSHKQDNTFPIHKQIIRGCNKKQGLIVDLGCGVGVDIFGMSSNANFCLGMDISSFAIAQATQNKDHNKNIEFKQANLEKLPLKDSSVDTVTSFFTFEHLFNPEKVLDEVDRVLKSKGEFFLLCPNYVSPFRGAPIFGGVHKLKVLYKMMLYLWRMVNVSLFRKKDFRVRLIDSNLIDLTKIGEDWDAVNEPSVFEFVHYFRRKGYSVDFQTWLSPVKSGVEKFFSYFKKILVIKYCGPVCYLHVVKK